jgi:Uma2 family endonuclease
MQTLEKNITSKISSLKKEHQNYILEIIDKIIQEELAEQKKFVETIKEPLYEEKSSYNAADILAIVDKFPKDKLWTFEDLDNELIFPNDLMVKIEILDYKIYVMPDPTTKHQLILGNIHTFLNMYVLQNKLGNVYPAPVSMLMNTGKTLKPDIVFIVKKNVEKVTDKGIDFVPDLVIEVISPANYKALREKKKQEYADFGVLEYWEVFPTKQQIKIDTLSEDENGKPVYTLFSSATKKGIVKSSVLEGFELDLENIF